MRSSVSASSVVGKTTMSPGAVRQGNTVTCSASLFPTFYFGHESLSHFEY
jgi:hypothetical protein